MHFSSVFLQHPPQLQRKKVCLLCTSNLHHTRSIHSYLSNSLHCSTHPQRSKSWKQLYSFCYLDLHKQYVIQLSTFLAPSFADFVATLLRVIIFAAIGVILLPSFIYSFAFGKFGVLWECIVGIPAYIFYFPTYVCILPIYARCRLDDIYSGDSFKNLKAVRNQNIK